MSIEQHGQIPEWSATSARPIPALQDPGAPGLEVKAGVHGARLLGFIGLGLALSGLALGFLPAGEGCGSAWNRYPGGPDLCVVTIGNEALLASALLIVGLILAAVGALATPRGGTARPGRPRA